MIADVTFWDRIAPKYAKSPIKNMQAYEATLERVRAYVPKDADVLEIGCGTGGTALKLAGSVGRYLGCDISAGMIDIARTRKAEAGVQNVDFTVAPVVETQFEPESFDAVLGFNILHLVPDLGAAVARVHQLLKPGGLFITKTPCLAQMGFYIRLILPVMQVFGKAPYVAMLRAAEVEQAITAAGFELVEEGYFDKGKVGRFLVARKL